MDPLRDFMHDRNFEDMVEPPLADRLRAFEQVLIAEPCANDGHCVVHSNMSLMCPSCRLLLRFAHLFYYAENYQGGPGEIPVRS